VDTAGAVRTPGRTLRRAWRSLAASRNRAGGCWPSALRSGPSAPVHNRGPAVARDVNAKLEGIGGTNPPLVPEDMLPVPSLDSGQQYPIRLLASWGDALIFDTIVTWVDDEGRRRSGSGETGPDRARPGPCCCPDAAERRLTATPTVVRKLWQNGVGTPLGRIAPRFGQGRAFPASRVCSRETQLRAVPRSG
jgi:hypothetical protein